MEYVFSIAKELGVRFESLEEISKLPYTISYVIRKRIQVDSLRELPEEKRPPDTLIWWGIPEDLDRWIKNVLNPSTDSNKINLYLDEVED